MLAARQQGAESLRRHDASAAEIILRIDGLHHAGIRLVLEGPTLVHALDAHATHPGPFRVDGLLPYRAAREPPCQTLARGRLTIMRRARSRKRRPLPLAELERRYREIARVLALSRAIA